MQEMRVRFLGQEDPLEEGMETHSSILAWKILWTEEPGGLQSTGSQRVKTRLSDFTFRPIYCPLALCTVSTHHLTVEGDDSKAGQGPAC